MCMAQILRGPLRRALIVERPDSSLDGLLGAAGFDVVRVDAAPDEDELVDLLRTHRSQVLFKRSRVQVTRRVVECSPDLVAIQLCSIGDDSIDKNACAERGVLVFNDPVSNGRSVVELAIGHLIALSRRLYETFDDTHAGAWEKSNAERYEVRGKVLGILGLGNIGRQVAKVATLLGMDVFFFDEREVAQEVGEEMGWRRAGTAQELFRHSDMVSVHVSASTPRGKTNEGLLMGLLGQLGAERPQNSPRVFVNLARGFLHAPEELLEAIDSGAIRRAAVDVYPAEPNKNGPGWENPYASEPRVATTPHIGAATQEAQPRIARRVAQTQRNFSTAGSIRDCVFSPRSKISVADGNGGRAVLLVVHSTARGTKKALDEAIYEAGASNLRSQHRDLGPWGIAVDANLLDRPLSTEQLDSIVQLTRSITGDPLAVRLVRQVELTDQDSP